MKKIILCICILIMLVNISAVSVSGSETDIHSAKADKLYALGLFRGTDNGYELERKATRAEAAVMLIRLLGLEEEVLYSDFTHPFDDVPDWAAKYVGYMYENELTKGIGGGKYGAFDPVDAKSYATFVLRSMGFSDEEGDFRWEDALAKALEEGIIGNAYYDYLERNEFVRGDMVSVSYNALNTPVKNETLTLAAILSQKDAFDIEFALELGYLTEADKARECLPYLENYSYLPDLRGVDKDTGLIRLWETGIRNISLCSVYDDYISEGFIINQNFHPYYKTEEGKEYILTVSKGPDPENYNELAELCEEKEWPAEIHPYIIAACRDIISDTVLSKTEVIGRLKDNLNEIIILSPDESAKTGFFGKYFDGSGTLQISAFGIDEQIIAHELLHALSYDPKSGKSGLSPDGVKYNSALEGYTSYLSSRSYFVRNNMNSRYTLGDVEFKTTSDTHFCIGSYDRYLEVLSPLFQLIGDKKTEEMYFADLNEYELMISDFNSRYGEDMWYYLMGLADSAMSHVCNMTALQQEEKLNEFYDYYDGILNCLETERHLAGCDSKRLEEYFDKLTCIKSSIPLELNNYRDKIFEMETDAADDLERLGISVRVAPKGYWIVPDYLGEPYGRVFSWIINLGRYSHGMTYTCGTSGMEKKAVEAIRFREGNEGSYISLQPGDEVPLDGEYIVITPKEGSALAHEGYYVQRNLLEDFANIRINPEEPEKSNIVRVLQSENLDVRIEYLYAGNSGDCMEGKLVGFFPGEGAALIPGESTVVLTVIKGK